jgi:hypothetical protein
VDDREEPERGVEPHSQPLCPIQSIISFPAVNIQSHFDITTTKHGYISYRGRPLVLFQGYKLKILRERTFMFPPVREDDLIHRATLETARG